MAYFLTYGCVLALLMGTLCAKDLGQHRGCAMPPFPTCLCALVLLMGSLFAKGLGQHGSLFSIEEEDFLQHIQCKLNALSSQQKLHLERHLRDHYIALAEEPPAVEGLGEASEYRTYTVDPSITVAANITDHEGRIIVPQGTVLNPLTLCGLKEELLFLDGDQPSHVEWARQQSVTAKWILVKGRPLTLEHTQNCKIYFDQFGLLSRKFDLRHIPAKISQEGMRLKVEEIPIKGTLIFAAWEAS